MSAAVAVLAVSDAFGELVSRVIATAGAAEAVLAAPEDAARHPLAAGVVVVAGGREDEALDAVRRLRAVARLPIAVVALEAPHRVVADVIRAGADEYLQLPGDLAALHAWMRERLERERMRAHGEEGTATEGLDFSEVIGTSAALRRAMEPLALVAPIRNATVLITGETGTGKDLVAQVLHRNSPRAGKPLVELNCTALPPQLMEAELFGYEAGAFTDARRSKPGLVEVANGGTLFLDEIGDLPLELQAKLLRVIETKQSRRVGALVTTKLDVRFIAATHVDLEERVRSGAFREDLFYRLNVVRVEMPALRERGSDVLLLAEWFAARFAQEYGLPLRPITATVRERLLEHSWPGNVRELRNAVERGIILGRGELREENLRITPAAAQSAGNGAGGGPIGFPATMAEIQSSAARAAVEHCAGNKARAARLLGISRRHLYVLLGLASEGGAP